MIGMAFSSATIVNTTKCPRCGSDKGVRCRTKTGKESVYPHKERLRARFGVTS